jgi:Fe-S cluster biogenesis protein NfuA
MSEEIKIKAEPLNADPDSCRFTVNRPVHPGGPYFYGSVDVARGRSALAEVLFALDGVKSVLIADNIVTIGKRSDVAWADLMKKIGSTIRFQLQTGAPAVSVDASAPIKRPENDKELFAEVERVLDEGINPYVAQHGGRIILKDVKDKVVFLEMTGGCQGCSSASATLRSGVRALIHEEIPEVVDIVDTTDHETGENPYFTAP